MPEETLEDGRTNAPKEGDASGLYDIARRAFMREDWEMGADAYLAAHGAGAPPAALDRLLFHISRIRRKDDAESLAALKPSLIRSAKGEAVVRRLLIGPYFRAGRSSEAAVALEKLLEAYPDLTDARRQLAGIYARAGRWDEAISHLDLAATGSPKDPGLQGARLQYRLMAGKADDAARIAPDVSRRLPLSSPEQHVVLLSLIRGDRIKDAADVAARLDPSRLGSAQVAASATRALLLAGAGGQAIKFAEAAIAAGQDSADLRTNLGEAILTTGRPRDIASKALEHLSAAVAQSPDDPRANALYGEVLLRTNRHEEAIVALEKANAHEAINPKNRIYYARALRAAGRHSDAADQYVDLLQHTPDRWASYRQTVGVLTQAGRREEASKIFNDMIAKRAATLPDSFEAALADLPNRIEGAVVPQARLDWAWSLRQGQDDVDRAEWERRAKWGMLSDLLIIDWLECREHQAEEAMSLMSNLDRADEVFAPMREKGQGFIIATAHLGPLFSGPILLELCSLPSRWVASTPSIADAHYAASVISTSDQSDAQVVKAVLKSLHDGYAVGIAVDGSGRLGSPTTRFEGQDITYSDFAARAAHRSGTPSLFYAARWEDGRIAYTFEPLPTPEPREEVGPFSIRWRDAYLGYLRTQLGGLPENLRLAGGLWSCIRAPDSAP